MSEFVLLERLTLAYGRTVVVDGLDLQIRKGELIALLGPSGCGKTTTMRAMAGLLAPKAGRIFLDGRDVTRTPPSRREIGLVFQSYALFPHLSVFENVAFGLRIRRQPDLAARVRNGLATVGLQDLSDRVPSELSGGQQQRVALARAIVMEPKVLLLDEPLSNLDARLRLEMRLELQRIQWETGVTMVFVTHDQSEALALADRIVVMRDGSIEQLGTPEDIYNQPVSGFVADFVGFEIVRPEPSGVGALAWRPNAVAIGKGSYSGVIRGVSFAGDRLLYVIDSELGPIKAETLASCKRHAPGESVKFDLPLESAVRLERMN